MKEILSLHVGQAGVQLGTAVWELLCLEHSLVEDGSSFMTCIDGNAEIFFQHCSDNKQVPRALFIDLEPSVIDEIRKGSYRKLFHPDRLISGPEDSASNFARGFYTVGKLVLSVIEYQIRKMFESADSVQAVLIQRALVGGTGSGLTSAMFEGLAEYSKTPKIELSVYPSPSLSCSTVEPYNCVLAEHFSMEDIGLGMLVDNESLYDISERNLYCMMPTYCIINRLIAQVISNITASIRFQSVATCDMTLMLSNLVPFPRIHHPVCNFSPLLGLKASVFEELTVKDITKGLFERQNQLLKLDTALGRYMSCVLFYRGNINICNVYEALYDIKRNKTIKFVDWCPTGFKVCICLTPPIVIPGGFISDTDKNVSMLTNTSAVGQVWQRLSSQFYMLYAKRSFIHWFVGEGIEECEFTESLNNISSLVKDYEEITVPSDFLPNIPPKTEKISKQEMQSSPNEIGRVPDHYVSMTDGQAISAPDIGSLANKTSLLQSAHSQNSKVSLPIKGELSDGIGLGTANFSDTLVNEAIQNEPNIKIGSSHEDPNYIDEFNKKNSGSKRNLSFED